MNARMQSFNPRDRLLINANRGPVRWPPKSCVLRRKGGEAVERALIREMV